MQVNEAFRTSERTFCGELELVYVNQNHDYAQFVFVDFDQEKVTLAPRLEDQAGYYDDAFLRFRFARFPDRFVDVPIISQVNECVVKAARFS